MKQLDYKQDRILNSLLIFFINKIKKNSFNLENYNSQIKILFIDLPKNFEANLRQHINKNNFK